MVLGPFENWWSVQTRNSFPLGVHTAHRVEEVDADMCTGAGVLVQEACILPIESTWCAQLVLFLEDEVLLRLPVFVFAVVLAHSILILQLGALDGVRVGAQRYEGLQVVLQTSVTDSL